MIKRVDVAFSNCGAQRIGELGLGDDGKGTLEDNFLARINLALPLLAEHVGPSEEPYCYEAAFEIEESNSPHAAWTFLGEHNKAHLKGNVRGPYTASNPLPALILKTRELFSIASIKSLTWLVQR